MTDLAVPPPRPVEDVQADRPETALSLARVGVAGVDKAIAVGPPGEGRTLHATIDCAVELSPDQRGAHMSRFHEAIELAIDATLLDDDFRADLLAARIAEHVRERQCAERAEASLVARLPRARRAPASGVPSHRS